MTLDRSASQSARLNSSTVKMSSELIIRGRNTNVKKIQKLIIGGWGRGMIIRDVSKSNVLLRFYL